MRGLVLIGDFFIFTLQTVGWLLRRRPAPRTLEPSLYLVGVRSVPMVAITGMFIGMVMAVQMYSQFKTMGQTWADMNRVPRPYVEYDPVMVGGQLAPPPSRQQYEPATQALTILTSSPICPGTIAADGSSIWM